MQESRISSYLLGGHGRGDIDAAGVVVGPIDDDVRRGVGLAAEPRNPGGIVEDVEHVQADRQARAAAERTHVLHADIGLRQRRRAAVAGAAGVEDRPEPLGHRGEARHRQSARQHLKDAHVDAERRRVHELRLDLVRPVRRQRTVDDLAVVVEQAECVVERDADLGSVRPFSSDCESPEKLPCRRLQT